MHAPNPLGNFPMILREADTADNNHSGELLLKYATNDLYLISKIDKTKKAFYTDIYQKMMESAIEYSTINIVKNSASISGSEPVIPSVGNREFNGYYYNIMSRETISA